jgi:peptide deformylase
MIHIPKSTDILPYSRGTAHVLSRWVEPQEFPLAGRLAEHLAQVMRRKHCVGMSAPMLGVFSMVVVLERLNGSLLTMVNPDIVRMYGRELEGFEACLSVQPSGNGCRVPRMETVDIDYFAPEDPLALQTITLTGGEAVVAQHEIDHLTGTYFFDRVSEKQRTTILENIPSRKDDFYGHAKNYPRPLSTFGA